MTTLTLTLLAWFASQSASAADLVLDGIDVYGTERLTVDDADRRYGKSIREMVKLRSRDSKAAFKSSEALRERIEVTIRTEWGFAWSRLSFSDYYADGKHKAFVSVDVVESKDRPARLAFRPLPTGAVPDPGGLLAAWGRYMDLGWKLFKDGTLNVNHDSCLSFFCEWGAQTPELRKYEELFVAQAKDNKEALLKVMKEDKSPAKRSAAAYLLAYLPDANESARLLSDALDDPDLDVRSAALSVYADYAVHHKEVFLPITRLQAALDFPTADDRNKAMAVVAGMASNPVHRRFLILKMSDHVLRLMRSRQPAISDTAYAAMGILAGESFDRRDNVSWERWLERAQTQELAKPEVDGASSP
ncbi:MAG: HEAT repeat domain-containing protein [Elusimicrobia bacterium]|nr:HEAT repeat domain-containing protein [Elusimicrobiota bacterium]